MSLASVEQFFYLPEDDGTFTVYSPFTERAVNNFKCESLAILATSVANTKEMVAYSKAHPPKRKGTLSL